MKIWCKSNIEWNKCEITHVKPESTCEYTRNLNNKTFILKVEDCDEDFEGRLKYIGNDGYTCGIQINNVTADQDGNGNAKLLGIMAEGTIINNPVQRHFKLRCKCRHFDSLIIRKSR